jgi:hypothetical protein
MLCYNDSLTLILLLFLLFVTAWIFWFLLVGGLHQRIEEAGLATAKESLHDAKSAHKASFALVSPFISEIFAIILVSCHVKRTVIANSAVTCSNGSKPCGKVDASAAAVTYGAN